MDSLVSQQIGDVLDAISECDPIDVVNCTPLGTKKKVKIVEPWEFLDLPEAGDSKRVRHPLKRILKNLSSEGCDTAEIIEEDSEDNAIQSTLPTMSCPVQWHPMIPEVTEKPVPEAIHQCTEENGICSTQSAIACSPQWQTLSAEVNEKSSPKTTQLCKEEDGLQASLPPMAYVPQWHPLSAEVNETLSSKTTQPCKEENGLQASLPSMACPPPWHPLAAVIPATCNPGPNGMQGLPACPMSYPGAPESRAIVPYVGLAGDCTPYFTPGSGVLVPAATGEMPAHQIHTPGTALPQGVVVAASSTGLHIPQQLAEEATRKREMRLMKNREAAKACRLRRKEYIRCLESHNAMLETHNKQLMQELEAYRNLYTNRTT